MESKAKEYQELYDEFVVLRGQVLKAEEPIYILEKEIEKLHEEQKKVNYNDSSVVVEYVERYIDEAIENEKKVIENDINQKIPKFTSETPFDTEDIMTERVRKNFDKVVKCLSMKTVEKHLQGAKVDFKERIDVAKAENATEYNITIILNTICAFAFRFDFLKFLPKAVRITAGIIFWSIMIIPKLVKNVYFKFQEKYNVELWELPDEQFEVVIKEILQMCLFKVILIAITIIVVNILVYFICKNRAKKYLTDNAMVCLSIINSDDLKKKLFEYSFNNYMATTVAGWKAEIDLLKNEGIKAKIESNSVINLIRNDLHRKYDAWEENIDNCRTEIASIRKQSEELKVKMQQIVVKLKEKESDVDSLVGDSNHNNAVLSPCVTAGYSQDTIDGVKELIYFKHNCKPMLICYDDNTVKDGERFRKNIARLIELFMSGFFQENYHAYINMWLVDFEGLYFPESRTKGLMRVIRTQQGMQQLFEELKNTRETVDALEDGRISNINPMRLANRENPIKYNIVYLVGYDFTTVEREISQLFIGGENFGFIPIIFMKQTLAQALIKDDTSTRAFARVVEKARDNSQIYGFEGIVSEFEYDLMVSNQKKPLDEKVCVKKIVTMDEFVETTKSGLNIERALYLDTYQLDKELYEAIYESIDDAVDGIKLFTINDQIPEFITKEVIKL